MNNDVLEISQSELDELVGLIKDHNSSPNNTEEKIYVFFDPETELIKSVSCNENEIDFPYIEVTNEEDRKKVLDSGVFYKFKVAFDPEQQKHIILEIDLDVDEITKAEDLTFQFPLKENIEDEEIIVIQNTKDKKWEFLINKDLSDELLKSPLAFDFYNLYITDHNDPNILHRTISVPMKDLLENKSVTVEFLSDTEFKELSIFSRKHFNTYVHIKK